MAFVIKVGKEAVATAVSFNDAKVKAQIYGGKIYGYHKVKMPKACTLRFSDNKYAKREMYREIYSENNHGYHFVTGRRKLND